MKRPTTWAVSMGISFLDIGMRGQGYNELPESFEFILYTVLSTSGFNINNGDKLSK